MNRLIITPEQEKAWRKFTCDFTREEIAEGEQALASVTSEQEAEARKDLTPEKIDRMVAKVVAMPPPTFILCQVVEPQPEREGGSNTGGPFWFTPPDGPSVRRFSSPEQCALAHSWKQNGNDGEPEVGERVELVVDELTPFEDQAMLVGFPVATLAAVPAVVKKESYSGLTFNEGCEPPRPRQVFSVQWQLSQEQSK